MLGNVENSIDDVCVQNEYFESLKGNEKCPHCGESYYVEKHSICTSMFCPPIYKDGVNINPDRNTTTTYCTCIACGKDFTYKR